MMDVEKAFDSSALENIRALQKPGMEDLVGKIVSMFFEDSERYSETIGQAIAKEDAGALGAAAHSLKSCAANVGAMEVSAIAARLELLGREQTLSGAMGTYEELQRAIIAVKPRLAEFLDD